jgi:hypothetical protein
VTPSPLKRLNGRSSVDVFEAAKELWQRDDPDALRSVTSTLRHGKRAMNRTAAAYALNLMHGKSVIPALERSVNKRQEHPKVRGQAAESLAHNHREKSHRVLLRNLTDPSKEVRFWCAYALSEMSDRDALIPLRKLAEKDHRIVRGFWSVSREAKAAIRKIQNEIRKRERTIRLAQQRLRQLSNPALTKEPLRADELPDYVLVIEGSEPLCILQGAKEDLRDTVFLELASGTMLDLESVRFFDGSEQEEPRVEFHFPKQIEGQATLDAESDRIVFHCKASAKVASPGHDNTLALRAEFKPRAMRVHGVPDL